MIFCSLYNITVYHMINNAYDQPVARYHPRIKMEGIGLLMSSEPIEVPSEAKFGYAPGEFVQILMQSGKIIWINKKDFDWGFF